MIALDIEDGSLTWELPWRSRAGRPSSSACATAAPGDRRQQRGAAPSRARSRASRSFRATSSGRATVDGARARHRCALLYLVYDTARSALDKTRRERWTQDKLQYRKLIAPLMVAGLVSWPTSGIFMRSRPTTGRSGRIAPTARRCSDGPASCGAAIRRRRGAVALVPSETHASLVAGDVGKSTLFTRRTRSRDGSWGLPGSRAIAITGRGAWARTLHRGRHGGSSR